MERFAKYHGSSNRGLKILFESIIKAGVEEVQYHILPDKAFQCHHLALNSTSKSPGANSCIDRL